MPNERRPKAPAAPSGEGGPLIAQDQPCTGSLSVRLLAVQVCGAGCGDDKLETATGLSAEEVRLERLTDSDSDQEMPWSRCEETDGSGTVRFTGLALGDYRVCVAGIARYELKHVWRMACDEKSKVEVDTRKVPYVADFKVAAGEEAALLFEYAPEQVDLSGCVKYRYTDEKGNPAERNITGLSVTFYAGGHRLDCATTEENGHFSKRIDCVGLVAVEAPEEITTEDGLCLQLATQPRIMAQAEPGRSCHVCFTYEQARVTLSLCAQFQDDGALNSPPTPIPATFFVYDGEKPAGTPHVVTSNGVPGLIAGLSEGIKTIQVKAGGPYQGRAIECLSPPLGILQIRTCSGQKLDLCGQFIFHWVRSLVVGIVTDTRTGGGIANAPLWLSRRNGGGTPIELPLTTQDSGVVVKALEVGDWFVRAPQVLTAPDGRILNLAGPAQQTITIAPGAPTLLQPFAFAEPPAPPSRGRAFGVVEFDDGQPAHGAAVRLESETGEVLGTTHAGTDGTWEIIAQIAAYPVLVSVRPIGDTTWSPPEVVEVQALG